MRVHAGSGAPIGQSLPAGGTGVLSCRRQTLLKLPRWSAFASGSRDPGWNARRDAWPPSITLVCSRPSRIWMQRAMPGMPMHVRNWTGNFTHSCCGLPGWIRWNPFSGVARYTCIGTQSRTSPSFSVTATSATPTTDCWRRSLMGQSTRPQKRFASTCWTCSGSGHRRCWRHSATTADTPLVVSLRLNALRDAPGAFLSRYEDYADLGHEDWQKVITQWTQPPDNAVFVATSGDAGAGRLG